MGKHSRQFRSWIKRYARLHGFRQDDFGELRRTLSKAEMRLRFAGHMLQKLKAFVASIVHVSHPYAELDIIERASEAARDDMQRVEDEHVFQVPQLEIAPTWWERLIATDS